MRAVKVLPKGQITLPKDVRDELGINIGDTLVLEKEGQRVLLRKGKTLELAEAVLNTPELKCELEEVFRSALSAYEERNVKFADALLGCWGLARGMTTVYTYDEKDFGRLEGLKVLKPQTPSRQRSIGHVLLLDPLPRLADGGEKLAAGPVPGCPQEGVDLLVLLRREGQAGPGEPPVGGDVHP